jgi:hypothetical protein
MNIQKSPDQICNAIVIKTKVRCSLKVSDKSFTGNYCSRHLSKESDVDEIRKLTKDLTEKLNVNEQPKIESKEQPKILPTTQQPPENKVPTQTKIQLTTEISTNRDSLFKLFTNEKIKPYNKTQLSLLSLKLQELITLLNISVKKKKVKISHILKKQVWDTYIGISIGELKCPMCKVDVINQMNFECGHVIPESKGGKTELSNLRPLCNKCNKSVGTTEMDTKHWDGLKKE